MKIKAHKTFFALFMTTMLLGSCCGRGCASQAPGRQEGGPQKGGNPDTNIPNIFEKIFGEPKTVLSESMVTFDSDSDFDKYVARLNEEYEKQTKSQSQTGAKYKAGPPPSGPMAETASEDKGGADKATTAGTSITNVQEAGVDEGDIVKVYKDYLVVLRRGRIFTIRVKDRFEPVLKPVSRVDAYPRGFTKGSWYDEMLIHENKIVVIGYSYAMSATEIGIFQIDDEGRVRHASTHFMDSNDYYSSRNYTSRLVGDTLIFYMPYYLFAWATSSPGAERKAKLPQIRRWTGGGETTAGKDILKKTDIYKPVQETMFPTLHVVARCDLGSPDLSCSAKAVLGPYSRSFYVSPKSVYVWVSPEYSYWTEPGGKEKEEARKRSYVYMIDLKDGSARAVQTHGAPIDQFSFKEDADGYLNVLVREAGPGDAMWNPEFTNGRLALMRTALRNFSARPKLVSADDYRMLPTPGGWMLQNRFAGSYLLYGTGSTWYADPSAEKKIYALRFASAGEVQQIDLGHGVDRIEVMGDGAVAIGSDGSDLKFSALALGSKAELRGTYALRGAVQGETRSHGFFYKAASSGGGILGLPIRKQGKSFQQLFTESAEVLFLSVDGDKKFTELGSLASKATSQAGDGCVASCVDWYGNSRPIFLGNRILALMGYEVVEGAVGGGGIKETGRTSFLIPDEP
jgi:hypothetical protein